MNKGIIKHWDIEAIEKITYDEAEAMAEEKIIIKEHDCFIVDFGGCFGCSILVFKDGKHIHYANNYKLHNRYIVAESGKQGLKDHYIKKMQCKLFTDDELTGSINSYGEYELKRNFLVNYWIQRYDHISAFAIEEKAIQTLEKVKKKYPYFNKINFCYVSDEKIVDEAMKYSNHLYSEYEKIKNNNDVFREMISRELSNYEACISCDYTEALKSLGLTFDKLSENKQRIVKEELKKQIEAYYD